MLIPTCVRRYVKSCEAAMTQTIATAAAPNENLGTSLTRDLGRGPNPSTPFGTGLESKQQKSPLRLLSGQ